MMEGRHERSGIDRRTSRAIEALLDLRQQFTSAIEGVNADLAFDRGCRASASKPMAGRSSMSTTPMTPPRFAGGARDVSRKTGRPARRFIIVRSVIGWGSPRAGSEKAHGEPLGRGQYHRHQEALMAGPRTRASYVPDGVAEAFGGCHCRARRCKHGERMRDRRGSPSIAQTFPTAEAAEFDRLQARANCPTTGRADVPSIRCRYAKGDGVSRDAGGKVLNAIAPHVPMLIGGAADLSPSTKTDLKFDGAGCVRTGQLPRGATCIFGVREHAMGAIANGHGAELCTAIYRAHSLSLRTICARRSGLRRSWKCPTIFIFTHDSASAWAKMARRTSRSSSSRRCAPFPGSTPSGRATPTRLAVAWQDRAGEHTHHPTALIFSRQPIPTLDRETLRRGSAGSTRGGYVLADCEGPPDAILIATGSELSLVVAAHDRLTAEGVRCRASSRCRAGIRFETAGQRLSRERVLPPDGAERGSRSSRRDRWAGTAMLVIDGAHGDNGDVLARRRRSLNCRKNMASPSTISAPWRAS